MFRVESARPQREHRPNCTKRPQHESKLQPRSDPAARRAKAFHTGRGKRRNRGDARAVVPGRTLPQKPKWRHTSAVYTETRAGTILSSSITGSELC